MTTLNSQWVLWYHDQNKDWSIKGYKKIFEIKTIEDFWEIYLRLKNTIILKGMFFLMKKGVLPIWETDNNKHGGCWSYKISKNDAFISWLYLSVYLCSENITKETPDINQINGISISPKKNFCIIKMLNNNRECVDNIIIDKINNINLSLCLYKPHKDRN